MEIDIAAKNLLEGKTCKNCTYYGFSESVHRKRTDEICCHNYNDLDLPTEKICDRWRPQGFVDEIDMRELDDNSKDC